MLIREWRRFIVNKKNFINPLSTTTVNTAVATNRFAKIDIVDTAVYCCVENQAFKGCQMTSEDRMCVSS